MQEAGWNRTPKTFGLVKIRAKCVKAFAKSLHVLWFHKNCTQSQSAGLFHVSCFSLVLFDKLGEIWAKMVLEVPWIEKIRSTWNEMQSFFWGNFLWSFFRASLGKFGQNFFAPPKFVCSYTYGYIWKIWYIFGIFFLEVSVEILNQFIWFITKRKKRTR